MTQKITFKIIGTHCQSCKTLLESEIGDLNGVKRVNVNYLNGETEIEYFDSEINPEEIYQTIKNLNYEIADKKLKEKERIIIPQSNSFLIGLLIPLFIFLLIGGYLILKVFGGFEILAKLNESNIGYGLIFLIGILAGFHCIGMCGGLVITYSTLGLQNKKEQSKNALLPHLKYNSGRLISYSLIGGILGSFGSFFAINPTFTGLITLLAGVFMFLMGLSLVSKSPFLEKIKVRTPQLIAKYIYNQKYQQKAPFVIGLLNGLMPCGPLQAMQLYALTSGSFAKGAASLFVFALGTIPLMFSFGAFLSKISQQQVQKVLKFSGVLVIVLSLLMVNRGLANFGYGFVLQTTNNNNIASSKTNGQYQTVNMDLTYFGYQPNVLYVKKGIPVRWVINAKEISGCTSQILMPDYNVKKTLAPGENIIEFTPERLGEIKFSCGMRMVWGKFIVTEDGKASKNDNVAQAAENLSVAGCGCSKASGSGNTCH